MDTRNQGKLGVNGTNIIPIKQQYENQLFESFYQMMKQEEEKALLEGI